MKLNRLRGLLPSLFLSNIWTVIDKWIEHKFTTQNWSQVLINIDVSHNLLINPYPPHVAERGLLKTPHPHKAVHVVYLQSLISIFLWFELFETLKPPKMIFLTTNRYESLHFSGSINLLPPQKNQDKRMRQTNFRGNKCCSGHRELRVCVIKKPLWYLLICYFSHRQTNKRTNTSPKNIHLV